MIGESSAFRRGVVEVFALLRLYKFLHNFNLLYFLISYTGIAIALLYNVPLAIHYQWQCTLIPYTIEPAYNDIGLSDI